MSNKPKKEENSHGPFCNARTIYQQDTDGTIQVVKKAGECDCGLAEIPSMTPQELEKKVKEWLSQGNAKEWPEVVDFISSLLQEHTKEMVEKLSWLTRYERSKFRADLSDAQEEGTESMLLESEVLQAIKSFNKE